MSDNKLVEKTREVFYKQKELSDLIDGLKDEVKKVYYENQELSDENKLLREQINLLKSGHNEPLSEPSSNVVPKEDPKEELTAVEESVIKNEVPIKGESVVSKDEAVHDDEVYTMPNPLDNHNVRETRKNAIAEFFLGKNVIAKIAAILIFLGVLTFGQMAYVDWLNDVGRSLLILFTGAIFGLVGWYTEKKKHIVFSNVFYGISLFIIFYSILLAGFTFNLFSVLWIGILLLVLLLATMVYFKDKRYDFLDMVLFIFYLVVGFAFLYLVDEMNIVLSSILSVVFVGLIGYNVYMFVSKYYRKNEVMSAIFQVVHLISVLYFLLFVLFREDLLTDAPVAMIVYAILQVGILYIIGFNFDFDKYSKFRYFSPTLILVALYPVVHILDMAIFRDRDISFELSFLSYAVLLVPLYIFLFRKYKEVFPNVARTYLYTIGVSYLFFALSAHTINGHFVLDVPVRFALVGFGLISSYIVYLLQGDKMLRFLFWKYTISLVLFSTYYIFIYGAVNMYDMPEAIVLGVISLVLLAVNLVLKYWRNLEQVIEKEIIKLFLVYSFLPLIFILMLEYISTDSAYLMAVVMLWLVGNRWLSEIKPLKTSFNTYYTLVLNVIIVLLTFGLNLIYFDHDFSQFSDVFKLVFMFLVNVYVVFSLKEIYVDHLKKYHEEGTFIVVYLIGVLVHSYYIHRYINIEFDKVILSSYFLIASAVGVLIGFRQDWSISRRLGLFAIYFSLLKFFIYDFYTQDFSSFVRMMTYFILGFVLLGISILYAYLERTYKKQ